MTAIPNRRGVGAYRGLIDLKDDHANPDRHCTACWHPEVRWGHPQSGAAMRDNPLPAAPVWVRGALALAAAGVIALTGCGDSTPPSKAGVPDRPKPTADIGAILAQAAPPTKAAASIFGNGVYEVLADIRAGTYKTSGPAAGGTRSCYWARLKATDGQLDSIITNGIAEGPTAVTIDPGDKAFESHGCSRWVLAAPSEGAHQ